MCRLEGASDLFFFKVWGKEGVCDLSWVRLWVGEGIKGWVYGLVLGLEVGSVCVVQWE